MTHAYTYMYIYKYIYAQVLHTKTESVNLEDNRLNPKPVCVSTASKPKCEAHSPRSKLSKLKLKSAPLCGMMGAPKTGSHSAYNRSQRQNQTLNPKP